VIEIRHEGAQSADRSVGAGDLNAQSLVQSAPIAEARQRIGEGHLDDLRLALLQLEVCLRKQVLRGGVIAVKFDHLVVELLQLSISYSASR
jgi:hypothetical protein